MASGTTRRVEFDIEDVGSDASGSKSRNGDEPMIGYEAMQLRIAHRKKERVMHAIGLLQARTRRKERILAATTPCGRCTATLIRCAIACVPVSGSLSSFDPHRSFESPFDLSQEVHNLVPESGTSLGPPESEPRPCL